MSGNTIGKLFTVTSFGESHGVAIGCIIDGCPPGMSLSEADIQPDLEIALNPVERPRDQSAGSAHFRVVSRATGGVTI